MCDVLQRLAHTAIRGMPTLQVDFQQQFLNLQNQNIENLNIQQQVPNVLALNVSSNPIASYQFLLNFPNLRILHCDNANATEQLVQYLPDSLQQLIIRFNQLRFIPSFSKTMPNLQQLDISGHKFTSSSEQNLNFENFPAIKKICFGNVQNAQIATGINTAALLHHWLSSFSPRLVYAAVDKFVINNLRFEFTLTGQQLGLQIRKIIKDVQIKNAPVQINVFSVLTHFEINYVSKIETKLANLLGNFVLDYQQFVQFGQYSYPAQQDAQLDQLSKQLETMRSRQLNANNYIALGFLYEGSSGAIVIDLLNNKFIDFQNLSMLCQQQLGGQSISIQHNVEAQADILQIGTINQSQDGKHQAQDPAFKSQLTKSELRQSVAPLGQLPGQDTQSTLPLDLTNLASAMNAEIPEFDENETEQQATQDIYILPLRPQVGDGLTINDTRDLLGVTWYCSKNTIVQLKNEAQELLRFNTKYNNIYVDGFFFASCYFFNQFDLANKSNNKHNQIFSTQNEEFLHLVLKQNDEPGISMKMQLLKQEQTVPSKQFIVGQELHQRIIACQLRYAWGYRVVVCPNSVQLPFVKPTFAMKFANPNMVFTIKPLPEQFNIQVYKNNVEMIMLENATRFNLIESVLHQAGFQNIDEFLNSKNNMKPKLDGLYSAVLIPKNFEGFQTGEQIYCEDLFLRGELSAEDAPANGEEGEEYEEGEDAEEE